MNETELDNTPAPRSVDQQQACSAGAATPDAPEREWACVRCMYSWDGNGGWCPSCNEQATHGRAFAPVAVKKSKLIEKLQIIQSGKTAIMPTGEIVERGTAGSTDYDSPNAEVRRGDPEAPPQ